MGDYINELRRKISEGKIAGKNVGFEERTLERLLKARALESQPPPIRKPLPRQPPSDSDSSSDSSASPIVLKVTQMIIDGKTVDTVVVEGMRYAYITGTQDYLGVVKGKSIVKDPKYPDPLQEYEVDD